MGRKIMNRIIAVLLLALIATTCNAFAPSPRAPVDTCLAAMGQGSGKASAQQAQFTRGGKNSWAFEVESMYVDTSKPNKYNSNKRVPIKKTTKKGQEKSSNAFLNWLAKTNFQF